MPRVSLVGGGKGGARVEGDGKDPRDSDNTWSMEAVNEMRNSWTQLSLQARASEFTSGQDERGTHE